MTPPVLSSRDALAPIFQLQDRTDVRLKIGDAGDLLSSAGAIFSLDERYRYLVWRIWNPDLPFWAFGMLNPSTADHLALDPTVTRCKARAVEGGAGGLLVWNLFAYRATDPKDMKAADDPVGPLNDLAIRTGVDAAAVNVAGWGAHGSHLNREFHVREMLARHGARLHAIDFTAQNLPRHPLYLSFDLKPQPWEFWL